MKKKHFIPFWLEKKLDWWEKQNNKKEEYKTLWIREVIFQIPKYLNYFSNLNYYFLNNNINNNMMLNSPRITDSFMTDIDNNNLNNINNSNFIRNTQQNI